MPNDATSAGLEIPHAFDPRERDGVPRIVVCGGPDDRRTTLIERLRSSGAQRGFIVLDGGPDVDSTRAIIAAAPEADAAVILVDASTGITRETRRDTYLLSLLGVRNVVLAIDALDPDATAGKVFKDIARQSRQLAGRIANVEVTCIPISVAQGNNVTARSGNMPWFEGPTLADRLNSVATDHAAGKAPFRMFVDGVDRSSPNNHAASGRIASGSVRAGDRLRTLPSGRESLVARVTTKQGELDRAVAGESVTIELAGDIELRQGDMLAAADSPPGIADQFEATLIWMSEDELLPGRSYLMTIGPQTVTASAATPKYGVNPDTFEHLPARTLQRNEIGICNLNLDQPIVFDPYAENRHTGGFVLSDPRSHETIGVGLLHFALRRSQNIHWQAIEVNKKAHATLNGHRPCIVWFTGLSGAGKSTIANLVEKRLHTLGHHTYLLDGDNVRHGLNKDLGFTEADRVENIRRVAEVARLMVDAGLIVLVSFISPFTAERRMARSLVGQGEFHEVFVDAPLDVAEQRDRKGLYRKARRGELKNFTGIDSPYEPPEQPEIRIDTTATAPEDAARAIVAHLKGAGVFDAT